MARHLCESWILHEAANFILSKSAKSPLHASSRAAALKHQIAHFQNFEFLTQKLSEVSPKIYNSLNGW